MRRPIIVSLVVVGLGGAVLDEGPLLLSDRPAHAVVGRPLTPVSYAGVARRTARRTTRRTMAVAPGTITTLPPSGCVFATGVYTCGTIRYRPRYDGPTVVYQAVD